MKCPYSEIQLLSGLLSADQKFEEYDKDIWEELNKSCPWVISATEDNSEANVNRMTAKHHGISVETLVSSPNYDLLKTEYREHNTTEFIEEMKKVLNLTDKEAWAVFVEGVKKT